MKIDSGIAVWCDWCTLENHYSLIHYNGKTIHLFKDNLEYLEWMNEKRSN